MPRRRYRFFVILALIAIILFYRASQKSWSEPAGYGNLRSPPKPAGAPAQVPAQVPVPPTKDEPIEPVNKPAPKPPAQEERPKKLDPVVEDTTSDDAPPRKQDKTPHKVEDTTTGEIEIPKLKDHGDSKGAVTLPDDPADDRLVVDESEPPVVPDAVNEPPKQPHSVEDGEEVRWKNPPLNIKDSLNEKSPAEKHWKKPKENFALEPGEVIPLPKGKPKKIPQIQYDFPAEPEQAKALRLKRQSRVKAELQRAWSGYRRYAWMHDELSPVSNKYRDPFCGWAATLVDTLDTLWIAGMTEEFDEAAKAVKDIDFTFSPRNDIPVFETTIRYLGGLIAAYDVSGGAKGGYDILLEKAVELAEILMGVFDTPNRMPVLFYRWRPPYSSQPHRASVVGLAELGTLAMEFTRLAQLTKEDKYYDAVDRITNALVEMQKAGTSIPGLFPERIDASGCNKSASTEFDSLSKSAQKQIDTSEYETPEGYMRKSATMVKVEKEPADDTESIPKGRKGSPDERLERRAAVPPPPNSPAPRDDDTEVSEIPDRKMPDKERKAPLAADGSTAKWDCTPQGLVSAGYGRDSFHLGGAQDSAYEYFPKQYLLLGGLEPKYKKLHEDAIDAAYDWLLFRPMIKDEGWDILFSAKINTAGDPENDIIPSFETTHLTCFVGGMFGMGGKIFNRPKDVETAKKLTDGCVWAYQSTASGIMPEYAQILPCPTLQQCEFNETLWWESLDPHKIWRESEIAKWEEREAEKKLAGKEATSQGRPGADDLTEPAKKPAKNDEADADILEDLYGDSKAKARSHPTRDDEDSGHETNGTASAHARNHKRELVAGVDVKVEKKEEKKPGSELPDSLREKVDLNHEDHEDAKSTKKVTTAEDDDHNPNGMPKLGKKKLEHAVEDSDDNPKSPPTIPSKPGPFGSTSQKPLTHEEFIKNKIQTEKVPPGYTNIVSKSYILRPEAIESVWYMYRITGDPEWMDKGWTMFEATVAATRTQFANSAIDNVLSDSPRVKDEMESFWLAETLKYYYLLFSEPDVISLDEWVLNTEAHPFKRPV